MVRINDTVKISGNAPLTVKISLIVLNPNRKRGALDFWNAKSVIYYLNQVFSGRTELLSFSIKFSESIETEYSLLSEITI